MQVSSQSYSTDFSTTSESDSEIEVIGSGQVEILNRTPIIEPHEMQYDESNILGSGAFGKVYRGKCRGDNVAIKILTTILKDSEIREFKNECEILMSMRHRNIVTFMGACVETNNLAMVTELLDGDLEHFLENHHNAGFTFLQRLKMMRDIAKGMAWLHGANPPIVHRDLKPSNILLDSNLEAKITDFGLSIFSEKKAKIKKTAGSALWMAPECHRGESYDEKVDVYSFGIVSWQIMTGELLPFRHYVEQDAFREFVDAVSLDDERPDLKSIPSFLHDLFNNLWNPDPEKRLDFQSSIFAIDEAILQAMLIDENSRNFWRQKFGDKLEVKWKPFFNGLVDALSIRKPEKNLRDCFKILFCPNEKAIVTLERFGDILKWFGPLRIGGRYDDNLVDRLEAVVQCRWFWGDIPRDTAVRALNNKTFLIRLSHSGDIRKTPFSLSIKLKGNNVQHFRVEFLNGHYHLKQLMVKGGKTVNLSARTVIDLIEGKFHKTKPYKDFSALPESDFDKILSRNPGEMDNNNYANTSTEVNYGDHEAAMAIFGYNE